jgi:aspartate/methionine/tyrosine aminotransferase
MRRKLWEIVAPLGTVKSFGAFYFLVPVPPGLTDDEAVDILALKFLVLVMPGTPFGAPGYLRISYGNIPSNEVLDRLRNGMLHLQEQSSIKCRQL